MTKSRDNIKSTDDQLMHTPKNEEDCQHLKNLSTMYSTLACMTNNAGWAATNTSLFFSTDTEYETCMKTVNDLRKREKEKRAKEEAHSSVVTDMQKTFK